MLFAVSLVLVGAGGALATPYDYTDNTLVQSYQESGPVIWKGGEWHDVIGDSVFNTLGANLSGNTLTIFSNWNPDHDNYGGYGAVTADLFIFQGTKSYAIQLDTTTGLGKVYTNPEFKTSVDLFSKTGLIYGGSYDMANQLAPVQATSGQTGTTSVDWTIPGSVAIDLTGIVSGGKEFKFFWGTATCSNDAFAATATTVPLPPSFLLMGSSLLGLVGFRRFRKN